MDNVIMLKPKVTTDEYFGGCPECGKNDGYLNSGGEHWFICHAHRTKWCIGWNVFSSWRDETKEERFASMDKLATYRAVEPIHPEPTEEERVAQEQHERESKKLRLLDRGHGVICEPGKSPRALGPDENPLDLLLDPPF